MNEPFKIIYKYKNLNRTIKYHILIFIGNLIDTKLIKILNIIKNLNLYDTLMTLTNEQIKLMENNYSEYWYNFFFIHQHISFSFDKIKNNNDLIQTIKEKYNEEWYNKHINNYLNYNKKSYSFQNQFKQNNKLKSLLKNKKNDKQFDESEIENYNIQNGGNDDNEEVDNDMIDDIDNIDENNEFNIDDIDKMINEELELNKNISSKDNIEDVLKKYDNKQEIDNLLKLQEWDKSNDNSMVNDNLKDLYNKVYLYNQYIFKDDTVLNIKKKICCAIKKNQFYKNDDLLIPSRIYLWSIYNYNVNNTIKLEKITLGHKWINKTELLNIDIEPNDKLYNYENLNDNLKLLQDNIKKYSSKISFENDNFNILYDYDNFIYNNEIYMIDIYNELGKDYKLDVEKLKNVFDTYVSIYYPLITHNDYNEIIDYLNGIKIERT